jgi:branched-chain amino acid transport system permease protein
MADFVQLLVSGVSQGMIYALLAVAYNITFSTSRTINFAIGNLLMMGGVVGFSLYIDMKTGQPLGRSFLIPFMGVLVVGSILGAFINKFAVEPSRRMKSEYGSALATLAVGIVLRNLVERRWSTDDYKFLSPVGDSPIRIFGAGVYPQEVLIIAASIFIVVALETFKSKTVLGRSIQAISEDRVTASLMGINPGFIVGFSFILSAMIAGVAGLLVAPITLVSATMGTVIGIKAYAVSIIGGLESGYGTIVGGIILGLCEVFTARFISSGYKDTTGFVFLILIILLRPNGIFGRKVVRKV